MNVNKVPSGHVLQHTLEAQQKRMQQLASANRVNSAADDAAALQIIERMNAEASAYQRSVRNAFDGISMLQVADGAMQKINDDLQRIRELTIQSGNGALNEQDRNALQAEVDQLRENISRITETTNLNGKALLKTDEEYSFLVGSGRGGEEQRLAIGGHDLMRAGLDRLAELDLRGNEAVGDSLRMLDEVSEKVTEVQAQFGAQQQAFMSAINNLTTAGTNTQAARSRIRDLDYAQATAENTRLAILAQAGIAVRGQANLQQGQILGLLD